MTKTIELTKGQAALVDDEDFEWLNQWKWYALTGRHGEWPYAARRNSKAQGRRKLTIMHRVIVAAPDNVEVDHINGDTLDNRKINLRLCTRRENSRNRRLNTNSQTGYKGVSYRKKDHKWEACLYIREEGSRRHRHLGKYDTAEEAARVYDDAARALYNTFARTNAGMGLLK